MDYKVESAAIDVALQVFNRLKELSLSQCDLANRLSTSSTYVSQILNGKPNMTLETLSKIADALDLELKIHLVHKRNICVISTGFLPGVDDMTLADSVFAGAQMVDFNTNRASVIPEEEVNEGLAV